MKTRLPADRLQEKSAATLVTNHLRQRYLFSPVVAETLTDDLQHLSHKMNEASQLTEGQVLYAAVKADEPSGKALKDCQYVMVRLTIFARSDIVFQQCHSMRELKKRILHRITTEADTQGGPLTYEDLARLLFADRKTIGQYIQELRVEGQVIITRSTYTDASAAISHHRPIVRLFLLKYTETEIAQRLNHTLSRVEGYIKDFLRICVAHRQGYTVEGVRHLTGLSKRVVEKHLVHYTELDASSFWQEHLERKLRFYEASIDAELAKKGALA
jgi:predicted transcriptional regulator